MKIGMNCYCSCFQLGVIHWGVVVPRKSKTIQRRAIRVDRGTAPPVYQLSLRLDELLAVADVSRVEGVTLEDLVPYRLTKVRSAVDALSSIAKSAITPFPYPITLALSSRVKFRQSRGPAVGDGTSLSGTLEIPFGEPSNGRVGLVVDGHFPLLAAILADVNNLPLAVFAFVCDDERELRKHFLALVTQQRLTADQVDQMIPEVLGSFSPKLSAKDLPVALCDWLNESENSPFYGLVKGSGKTVPKQRAIVPASTLTRMIDESLSTPSGCLFSYRNIATGETDMEGICRVLMLFWTAVKNVFPDDWAKLPSKSRLMHVAGIRSMGRLMDRITPSINIDDDDSLAEIEADLQKIAPMCRWSSGTWDGLDLKWNEIQSVPRHIHLLSNLLVRAYAQSQKLQSK